MKFLIAILALTQIALAKENPWQLDLSKMDRDGVVYLGQDKSTVDWNNIKPDQWLSFKVWQKERVFKDQNPLWKVRSRERLNIEKIGLVLKCIGTCQMHYSAKPKNIGHGSTLMEGDEVSTLDDSLLWIVLANGAIVRLSPNTSISLNEFNILPSKSLTSLRLNDGHIYFESRRVGEYAVLNLPETDQAFLPLQELKANREFYQIREYRSLKSDKKALYEAERNPGAFSQYKSLNRLISNDGNLINRINHEVIVNTPSFTVDFSGGNFNLAYRPNGLGFIKYKESSFNFKRNEQIEKKDFAKINLRDEFKFSKLEEGSYQVAVDGRHMEKEVEGSTDKFKFMDLTIKRIPSLLIAREIALRKMFGFLFKKQITDEDLAANYGYILWSEENIKKRISFLKKAIFNREIKNFALMQKVFKKNEDDSIQRFFHTESAIIKAKNEIFRSGHKAKQIRRYSNLEYFVWVMQNAK